MLTIRLSRMGKKKKAMYRLIISEKAKDPYGRSLEILGSYNPFTKELEAKEDRIKYWLSQGSGMSPTINNLLVGKGIIKGEKVKASKVGKKKKPDEVEEKKEEKKKDEKPAEKDSAEDKKEEKTADAPAKETKEEPKEKPNKPVEENKADSMENDKNKKE